MCKVCRLWGVLSLALLSYACRPNFHHKHLTLTDPSLSVCGEALISLHTCADRPKILKSGLCMNARFHVCVCVYVHVRKSMCECRQSCICVHAWMCQAIQDYPPCSSYSASSFSRFVLCFLTCLHFSARRHSSVQRENTAIEESLSQRTDSVLSPPFISFLRSSVVGQMKIIKPNNHMELWDKYLLLLALQKFLISCSETGDNATSVGETPQVNKEKRLLIDITNKTFPVDYFH